MGCVEGARGEASARVERRAKRAARGEGYIVSAVSGGLLLEMLMLEFLAVGDERCDVVKPIYSGECELSYSSINRVKMGS